MLFNNQLRLVKNIMFRKKCSFYFLLQYLLLFNNKMIQCFKIGTMKTIVETCFPIKVYMTYQHLMDIQLIQTLQ